MDASACCIIYNPFSQNGLGEQKARQLFEEISAKDCIDMTTIKSYKEFFDAHTEEDIIVCGGDGTLNRFINDTKDINFNNSIYYYACGSGNDFLRDINGRFNDIINIDKYIKNLPICTVNDKDYKFINGIGYGIDGYCCEVGDKLRREKPGTKINYTGIAIKGLLFHYKPTSATVVVDGVVHNFKKVWIAPTMLGRFYGGGMMPTPEQDRFGEDRKLSLMIFHGTGKLSTLMIFPGIFKGAHVKKEKAITILTVNEISVEFDSPRALQIDGETLLNITKYSVKSAVPATNEQEELELEEV